MFWKPRGHLCYPRITHHHGAVLEEFHGFLEPCLQPEVLHLQAPDPVVKGFASPRPAEACNIVLQEAVGPVLLPGDPLDLHLQMLTGDEILNPDFFLDVRGMPAVMPGREVPDHHLAVSMDPGAGRGREVLEGQDNGVELCIVVGCPPLVAEEDLLSRKECDAVPVPAPVHGNLKAFMRGGNLSPRECKRSSFYGKTRVHKGRTVRKKREYGGSSGVPVWEPGKWDLFPWQQAGVPPLPVE